MTKSEEVFHEIAASIPDANESKMFGALCIKAPNGKAGVMLYKGDMVFKLTEDGIKEAMKLEGAKIFSPMEGRPMGGWVQLPDAHMGKWKKYAKSAMDHVRAIEVEKKPKKSKK